MFAMALLVTLNHAQPLLDPGVSSKAETLAHEVI